MEMSPRLRIFESRWNFQGWSCRGRAARGKLGARSALMYGKNLEEYYLDLNGVIINTLRRARHRFQPENEITLLL